PALWEGRRTLGIGDIRSLPERLKMNTIKYGVIGLGWFGQKHCEALAAIPGVELHALCTRTESRLAELADTFQVKKTFTDYRNAYKAKYPRM
ncbi:MAG: Gfo/Idh/MocA family oxidoreductase, partial [Pirellulaceae bacterium]